MRKITCALGLFIMAMLVGCAILKSPTFWRITAGGILRAAYNAGGAEAVEEKVDELEESGKLSHEAAEKIKTAALKGYQRLETKLLETKADEIVIEDVAEVQTSEDVPASGT